jgi:CheY-like chemotaxis protein
LKATILIRRQFFYYRWITVILTRKVYISVSAHGSDECLKIPHIVLPNHILLDIMMEPMNEWVTLEKIRENRSAHGLGKEDYTCGISGLQYTYR